MNLNVLLEPAVDLPRLQKILDELGHLGRVDTIRGWDKKTQALLYEAARGFRPVTLDDFVPPSTEPLHEVIHHGKNTLPSFSHFQKRFCKPEGDGKELLGYNHQQMSWATGPGYFVVHPAETEGEVDIDYLRVPSSKPAAWPPIKDNDHGLGRLVYGGMVDVMRGVSQHVSIGRARKNGKFIDAWFVLCREDPTTN
ncbi:hypothetical protein LVJ94_30215 [Pendulispora rubella]|uniref:Uncharacterized protein n=1 Tax=Pendulispora rubella TaxID=2741070 RepID=A0ABZ2KY02_9BACT